MRKILLLAVLLLSSYGAWANVAASGWCEVGAQAVVTSGLQSSGTFQASYPQCVVTVYPTGSSTPVPSNQIFSNNGSTVLGNPFTANTNGWWEFYAANGRYDIVLSLAAPVTISDVSLFDPATGSVATATTASGLAPGTYNYGSGSVTVNANTANSATTATHALNIPSDLATQSVVSPQAASFTTITTSTGPIIDITSPAYGASTGVSDNGPAIRAAVAATIAAHGELFIPCGIWNVSTPADSSNYAAIGIYPGAQGIKIRSPQRDCAIIQYTGGTNIGSVVEIAPTKPCSLQGAGGAFTAGTMIDGLTVSGNSHVTDGIVLIEQGGVNIKNLAAENVTTNAIHLLAVVGGHIDVPVANQTYNQLIPATVTPVNGLVMDGFSANTTCSGAGIYEHTTTLLVTSPNVAVHSGKGLWNKYAANIHYTACQVGDNAINLQDDGNSDLATDCMFEYGSGFPPGTVNLTGYQNAVVGGQIGPYSGTVLNITGTSNVVDNVQIGGYIAISGPATHIGSLYFTDGITDTSPSTVISGPIFNYSATPYSLASNVPQTQTWTASSLQGHGLQVINPVGTVTGTWLSANASTPVNIFTTNQFTTGKAWTAMLVGSLLTYGGSGYVPSATPSSPMFLTDTNNTISDGTNTCTFSVNGSGSVQMLANNANGCGFQGMLVFTSLMNTAAGGAPVGTSTYGVKMLGTNQAAPTVGSGQVAIGSQTNTTGSCGTLGGSAGCINVNVSGTSHWIPYF